MRTGCYPDEEFRRRPAEDLGFQQSVLPQRVRLLWLLAQASQQRPVRHLQLLAQRVRSLPWLPSSVLLAAALRLETPREVSLPPVV
jgi:hypothetical protein